MDKYTSLKLSKWLAENGFEGEGKYDCFHIMRYDILNDLCVRYAKELFGEEHTENTARFYHSGYCTLDNSNNAILQVGTLLQQGEKDEAEKYIMEHSILNPKKNYHE